jgi:hypothetical protein
VFACFVFLFFLSLFCFPSQANATSAAHDALNLEVATRAVLLLQNHDSHLPYTAATVAAKEPAGAAALRIAVVCLP